MTPESIDATLTADKAVRKAQLALEKAQADLRGQQAIRDSAVKRVAELESEIERVTHDGDTKADVLGLHGELTIGRVAVEDAARVIGPLGGAVRVQERAVANARLAVCRQVGQELRHSARSAEDAALAGLDQFDVSLDRILGLSAAQDRLKHHWFLAGGAKFDATIDLQSLERHEIQRLRLPHGALDLLRTLFRNVFSRGGRSRPAA